MGKKMRHYCMVPAFEMYFAEAVANEGHGKS